MSSSRCGPGCAWRPRTAARQRGGQQVERADDAQPPPAAGPAQLVDDITDDLQQRLQLVGRAAQVVGGEQEQRDDLDARLVAPAEQVRDLGRADPVPVVDVDEAGVAGPAAVAVQHQRDVPGPAAGRRSSRRSLRSYTE